MEIDVPSAIQFITVSLASNPQPQTLHVAQITNIIQGPDGKATIVGWGGVLNLTNHLYTDVIAKLDAAGLRLDLND